MQVDKHKRLSRDEIVAVYRRVFSTPDGQTILRDMAASYDGNTFNENPQLSAYKQGQRSVLIAIHTLLE